jgi:hypothetical protein
LSNDEPIQSEIAKFVKSCMMETVKVNIINQDALAILKGMEQAGLITLPKKEVKVKNLAMQLRGSISSDRAKEMIDHIEKERAEWDKRY